MGRYSLIRCCGDFFDKDCWIFPQVFIFLLNFVFILNSVFTYFNPVAHFTSGVRPFFFLVREMVSGRFFLDVPES